MTNKRELNNLMGLMVLSEVRRVCSKRKAAENMGFSVDTVSKYIGNLEDSFGAELVVNTGHGCAITAFGHKLLNHSAGIHECLKSITSVKPDKFKPSGEVRVGMMTGVSSNLVPLDLGRFFDNYPDIRLVSCSIQDVASLRLESFDIGICYEIPDDNNLEVFYVKEVHCGFFASQDYVNKYGVPTDENDMLKNHRLVGKTDHANYIKWWKEYTKKAKKLVYLSNMTFSLLQMIKSGLGIGIMPLRFKEEKLICLDNIPCDAKIKFFLVAHKDTCKQLRVQVCLDYYRKLLEKL